MPKHVQHVHFVGIGGYGMSALAMILLRMGYVVSGSDLKRSRLTDRLEKRGAKISFKHHPGNLEGCDLVVYSTAIPPENSELRETQRLKLHLWHRSELLAALVNSHYGIAVAGTHGKTTTTAMLSLLLEKGGLDPTAVIGGEVSVFDGNSRLGKSPYLVAEACESDNSFLRYKPHLAIVTNIEADHLENYGGDFNKLKDAYDRFLSNIDPGGCTIICGEDPLLIEKTGALPGSVFTYGVDDNGGEYDYTAKNISYDGMGSRFELHFRGERLADVKLSVPGRHNVCNATAAMAAAARLDVDLQACARALAEFTGAGRRFEILGDRGGITVVDDYAHHPTEIKATLRAARSCGKQRIIAIFQPHRYTRTQYFMEHYGKAFSDADMVFLHSIYAAGEPSIEGVTSKALAEVIKRQNGKKPVLHEPGMEIIADTVAENALPGDMIITMGAGDIWKAGHLILDRLPGRQKSAAGS